ncbi:Uncharacterised protein [Yersinia enterocolitica]|nr:Uncharacterised protein [Yersinia mollaretii]CNL24658.1 Uncharacterised protein [Yersinia enterocolitica]CQQ38650.1 Uncharacterised protein [Yersinia mollaretii]
MIEQQIRNVLFNVLLMNLHGKTQGTLIASLEILFFTLDDEVFALMKSKHDKRTKINLYLSAILPD